MWRPKLMIIFQRDVLTDDSAESYGWCDRAAMDLVLNKSRIFCGGPSLPGNVAIFK